MTVLEAITQLRALKPNQYDDGTLVGWLSNLDGLLYNEYVKWHEGAEDIPHGPYDPERDMDVVLLAPEPYADVYSKYLAAQVDYYNGEPARYNNSMIMYNMALSAFADWYNRSHLPRQAHFVKT